MKIEQIIAAQLNGQTQSAPILAQQVGIEFDTAIAALDRDLSNLTADQKAAKLAQLAEVNKAQIFADQDQDWTQPETAVPGAIRAFTYLAQQKSALETAGEEYDAEITAIKDQITFLTDLRADLFSA